jgi:signal transduction histidine kinase
VLHEFLSSHRAAIVERTRSKIALRLAPRATEEELENGIPLFLDQLIGAFGPSPGSSEAIDTIGESATRHGGHLLKQGFTLAQVVHDYGGVCQAITELASETKAPITVEEFHAFNRFLDDAIASAVTEYTRQRDQSIAQEGRERLGELAHELRNALGSAMISFDILRTGSVGLAGSTAGVLARSLRRLSTLVDSSLAGVRLESGIRAPERVSVREFIEEVEVGAAMEANAREVTLSVTLVEGGVDVEVDRALLAAAVSNVVNNAFKFGRPKGRVSLRTSSTEDRVFIEVEDECGGLPVGKADILFRPFEQLSADRTGLGLGLSISRKSVEANGGMMSVRNIPGVGCVFTIDLPRLSPAI